MVPIQLLGMGQSQTFRWPGKPRSKKNSRKWRGQTRKVIWKQPPCPGLQSFDLLSISWTMKIPGFSENRVPPPPVVDLSRKFHGNGGNWGIDHFQTHLYKPSCCGIELGAPPLFGDEMIQRFSRRLSHDKQVLVRAPKSLGSIVIGDTGTPK